MIRGRGLGLSLALVLAAWAAAGMAFAGDDPTEFNQMIETRPLPADARAREAFTRAVIKDELGDTEAAIAGYSRALRIAPSFAAALDNRGNAYRRLGRYRQAERDYKAALAAGDATPEYPDYGLGWIAQKMGDPAGAAAYYRQALAANPQFEPADHMLAALGPSAEPPIVLRPPGLRHSRPASVPTPALEPAHPPVRTAARVDLRPAIIGGMMHAPADPAGNASIQLGAWRDESAAAEGWNDAVNRSGDLLDGYAPHIIPVDLPGKGHWYRLRTGPMSAARARSLCEALAARGLDCLVAGALPVAVARRQ